MGQLQFGAQEHCDFDLSIASRHRNWSLKCFDILSCLVDLVLVAEVEVRIIIVFALREYFIARGYFSVYS